MSIMNVRKLYSSPELESVTADTESGFASSTGGITAGNEQYEVLDPQGWN